MSNIWTAIATVVILFTDRFVTRLVPFAIPGLIVVLLLPAYATDSIGIAATIASVWAIADLSRGIELDHEHKEHTLRDNVLEVFQ